MKKIIFVFSLFYFFTSYSLAQPSSLNLVGTFENCVSDGLKTDLSCRLNLRNESIFYRKQISAYIDDAKVMKRISSWLNAEENKSFVQECQYQLRNVFSSEKIIGPLCYLVRQQDGFKNRTNLIFPFVNFYLLESKLLFQEIRDDPQYSEDQREGARQIEQLIQWSDYKVKAQKCVANLLQLKFRNNEVITNKPFTDFVKCFNENFFRLDEDDVKVLFTRLNLNKFFDNHPGHVISETGWVGGNKVTYLGYNDTSKELADLLTTKTDLVHSLYNYKSSGSVENFKKRISNKDKNIFSTQEGFWSFENHPVWNQKLGIFAELAKGITQAKESIFIDVFFLGGTMGASLAKKLTDMLEVNQNLKVFILHDVLNPFSEQTKQEMQPVFNYLKAYSVLYPNRILAVDSYIEAHKTGLPKYLNRYINQNRLKAVGLDKHFSLYANVASDHSKVIVIDGKSKDPIAFVGSKNLTDASGAVCFDEVVKIEGPAAAVVQDDYYDDMLESLKNDKLYSHLANQFISLLRPFDLLERDINRNVTRSVVVNNKKENVVLRAGYNNWNSTRTNVIDQNVQAILFAKDKIRIKDQFLFDRNVILALQKAKIDNPRLDIKIILEPVKTTDSPDLPNILFADVLRDLGIQLRFAKLDKENPRVRQEYHMKTISTDGKFVISGSANKDHTTMYGSFREQQVHVYDEAATKEHDRIFDEHWKEALEFDESKYQVPAQLKTLSGESMTVRQYLNFLRNLMSVLYDSVEL